MSFFIGSMLFIYLSCSVAVYSFTVLSSLSALRRPHLYLVSRQLVIWLRRIATHTKALGLTNWV
jgi:hypothetical protein